MNVVDDTNRSALELAIVGKKIVRIIWGDELDPDGRFDGLAGVELEDGTLIVMRQERDAWAELQVESSVSVT
jgi:hypothetical protein